MEKNEYLCNVNKAEEQQFAILISELNSEREERRKIQKKFELLEKKNSALEAKNEQVQQERDEKVNEISVLVKQMAQYMMGNGPITLSEELKNSILAEFRAEQEEKDRKKDEAHAKEMQDLKDFFAVQIAAKDNELNALRAKYGESDNHGTTNPGQSISGGMSPEDRIKQLEQQKNKYAIDAYGQGTESEKYNHGCQDPVKADDLDLEGVDVPDERCVEIAKQVMEAAKQRKDMKGIEKPRKFQPLEEAALKDKGSQIILTPEGLPDDVEELEPEISTRYFWVEGHFRCKLVVRRKFKDPRGKYYYINLPEEYKNPMGRTEATESVIALVYTLHGEQRMTDSEIVTFLKSKGLNFSEGAVKNWIKKAADILAPLDEPTQEEILATGNDHVDESGIEVCDQRLPNKGEKEEDVEKDKHYFDRWMFCHHADSIKLTQFVFFERGRRTRKAVEAYLSKAKKRLFVNSDGCPIYKCYDVTVKDLEKCSEITDIIIRVSCLVHMRRPFFKLKDCSQNAIDIVHLADEVFHLDKQIKTTYKEDFEKIAQERVLQIGPILQSIKDKLDILEKELDQAKEPELVKAVKYAKKEYPCLLHCLKNGALDFSNNSVEREIRRLAKYRNNSFFVGSPKGGARLARTLTIFANCKAYNIDPYKYLCDVFRRIKTTAKDQLVNLVAHKWQPQMAPAIY